MDHHSVVDEEAWLLKLTALILIVHTIVQSILLYLCLVKTTKNDLPT